LQRCGNFKMEAQTIITELSRRPKLRQLEVNECVAQEERGILPVGMLSHCSWPTVDHVCSFRSVTAGCEYHEHTFFVLTATSWSILSGVVVIPPRAFILDVDLARTLHRLPVFSPLEVETFDVEG